MNRAVTTKIILAAIVICAFTLSTGWANTMKPVSPSTTGFSIQSSGSSLSPQLSLNGDSIFTTPPTFGTPVSSGGFTPVSGGPGAVTTQPVVPQVSAVPDAGSTVMLLGLAVFGLIVIRRNLLLT